MDVARARKCLSLSMCLAVMALFGGGCLAAQSPETKVISFNVNEDYYFGESMEGVAKDFELVRSLGLDTMRISIGWGDFEQDRGKYDFTWLHEFIALSQQYDLKLRPYICYAGAWSGAGEFHSPPNDYQDWYNFCYTLAKELKDYPNILSYEIWNEQNIRGWWSGTIDQYLELLRTGSTAIRAADPGKQILLGGFTRPAVNWLEAIATADHMKYFDVVPFHVYNETWGRWDLALEDTLTSSYYDRFLPLCREAGKPVWVNEIGYSTRDRTEEEQANALARAVGYLFTSPGIELISWYEIKDCDPERPVIGDDHNYHLGITTWPDRRPKLAFHTLKLLVSLLHNQEVTPANEAVTVIQETDAPVHVYRYLLQRQDGSQILFIYNKVRDVKCTAVLSVPGGKCTRWSVDGTSQDWSTNFDGTNISNIDLVRNQVSIFEISK